MFRSGRTRPAHARSSGSETLLRIRSLAGYIIGTAFNSLDAQREACAAFIHSQKHEGWTVVPAPYDDGGFSGGTMERPALKSL